MKTISEIIQVQNQRIAERIEREFAKTKELGTVSIRPVDEEMWTELGIDPAYELNVSATVTGWMLIGEIKEAFRSQQPGGTTGHAFVFPDMPVTPVDATRLREIRRRLSLSQTEFGHFLGGSSLRAVQDWESTARKIPSTVVEILRLKDQL